MFKLETLKSGLKIFTLNIKGTEAVTTLIMCGAGSRYEEKEESGISHFLEHMFFKGAKKYPNCKSVAEAIDSIGGEFNAFTDKEYVGYYVTTTKEKYEIAFDVLSDMLLNSKFDQDEIERERGVILEEINMYEDLPMHRVGEIFEEQIFGDNSLGWNIAGNKEIIKKINRNDFLKYYSNQYKPNNMVVAVVGSFDDEDKVISDIKRYFQFNEFGNVKDPYKFKDYCKKERIKLYPKKTEQAHIILGFPTIGSDDLYKYYTMKLLSIILGGNMSSRMFLEVRERQGLCYYVRTNQTSYKGAGYLVTSAGVDLNRVNDALSAITKQYKLIKEKGIKEHELNNAKEYLKGKMILNLEDSSSLAQFYANQLIVHKDLKTIEELKAVIDSIRIIDIEEAIKSFIKEDEMRFTMIGPFSDKLKFSSYLKF
jgi:predicted Zn-dependent peptidase